MARVKVGIRARVKSKVMDGSELVLGLGLVFVLMLRLRGAWGHRMQ